MLNRERRVVVHPPAADVGATIICETEELMAPWDQEKVWHIQTGIPFVYEALEVDLPPGRPYAVSWHRYTSGRSPSRLPPITGGGRSRTCRSSTSADVKVEPGMGRAGGADDRSHGAMRQSPEKTTSGAHSASG